MNLIEARTRGGRIGCCDEKCYNATTPPCHCVCGGKNHGVGLDQAVKNTRAMTDSEIELCAKTHPGDTIVKVSKLKNAQLELYPCPPPKP